MINCALQSVMRRTNIELNRIKKSVLNSKLKKTNSVTAEAGRLFNLAFEQNAEFDVNSREIRALEKLDKERKLRIFEAAETFIEEKTL
mgnify:CR=1 FL=1